MLPIKRLAWQHICWILSSWVFLDCWGTSISANNCAVADTGAPSLAGKYYKCQCNDVADTNTILFGDWLKVWNILTFVINPKTIWWSSSRSSYCKRFPKKFLLAQKSVCGKWRCGRKPGSGSLHLNFPHNVPDPSSKVSLHQLSPNLTKNAQNSKNLVHGGALLIYISWEWAAIKFVTHLAFDLFLREGNLSSHVMAA